MSHRGLRILLVTPWAEGVTGGVQTTTRMLAGYLTAAGHEVEVLAPAGGPSDTRTERPTRLSYRPMRAPFDPARPVRSVLGYLGTAPAEIVRLRGFIRARAFDVVNVHYPIGLFTNLALATIGGPPLVVSVHGRDLIPEPDPAAIDRGVRTILRLASALVSPSASFASMIEARYPSCRGKVAIVSHGIAEPAPAPAAPWPRPYVLCVAGLKPLKNLDRLITAFARVASRHAAVDLILAGSGPLQDELTRQVRDLGLETRVRFLGSIPPEETGIWQSWASVVAAPSPKETFGLAAAEAMIRGRPVLVAREGALGELVDDGITGLAASADQPDEMAAQIERLLGDGDLARRIGEAGRAAIKARCAPASMVAGYEAVFAGVRGGRACASNVGAPPALSPQLLGPRRD